MKKTLLAVLIGAGMVLGACGYAPMELKYEGTEYREDHVEELIEDVLEAENPGYDLEVDVIEEVEE